MELSNEAKAEIAAAVKILREDGIHVHKTYTAFLKSQEPPDPAKEPGNGEPPPPKPEPEPGPLPKRKKGMGLWGAED